MNQMGNSLLIYDGFLTCLKLFDMKINLEKSDINPKAKWRSIVELAQEFHCTVGALPSSYLDLLLGTPFMSNSTCDDVEEKLYRRLPLWSRQYISKRRETSADLEYPFS